MDLCASPLFLSLLSPSGCSEQVEVHTERRGVIYSPSWPLNYPAGVNCSWHIQGSQGEVITIRLDLHFMDLDFSPVTQNKSKNRRKKNPQKKYIHFTKLSIERWMLYNLYYFYIYII